MVAARYRYDIEPHSLRVKVARRSSSFRRESCAWQFDYEALILRMVAPDQTIARRFFDRTQIYRLHCFLRSRKSMGVVIAGRRAATRQPVSPGSARLSLRRPYLLRVPDGKASHCRARCSSRGTSCCRHSSAGFPHWYRVGDRARSRWTRKYASFCRAG
jgi:hypothetical protein